MPFTSTEIQQAVERLVRSSIRRPYDTLGTRRVDVSFNDMQEAAAGVFLLKNQSPFYVLSLGAVRLQELVASESEQVQALLDAVSATGRSVLPINDVTSLGTAHQALGELEGAVGGRTGGFNDITKVPAFVRYKANLDKFLAESGSNVKLNGDVVQTPEQARSALAGLVTTLREQHEELVRLARLLSAGMADYASVNLPSLVARGVISRSRELLGAHVDELDSLTPQQRLESLRQVVLDILAQKTVVTHMTSFAAPEEVLTISGTGSVYSDATHPSSPAVASLIRGPYNIRTGRNVVDVFLDEDGPVTPKIGSGLLPLVAIGPLGNQVALFTSLGPLFGATVIGDIIYVATGANMNTRWVVTLVVSTLQVQATGIADPTPDPSVGIRSYQAPSFVFTLANSFVAEIRATVDEPYIVTSSNPDNRFLGVTIDGSDLTITLTTGTRSADQIAADITAQNGGQNFIGEGFFGSLKFNDKMNLTQSGPTAKFTVVTGNLDGRNIKVGDKVKVMSGVNAGVLLTITAVDGSPPMTFVDATGVITPEANVLVEIGDHRRVRVVCPNKALALTNRTKLTITDDVLDNFVPANNLFGLFPGQFSQTEPTKASDVVTDMTNQTTQITPSVGFTQTYLGLARTEPLFGTHVVFYKLRTTASIVFVVGFIITVSVPSGDVLSSGVEVGDLLVLREGGSPGEVFTITSASESQIVAAGSMSPALDTNILIEVGPALGTIHYGAIVHIPTGPNTGDHYIASQHPTIKFQLELQQNWPQAQISNAQPLFFTDAALGSETVRLASTDTTTASYIRVTEANPLLVTDQLGVEAFMTTEWFKLPEVPETLDTQDLLELYATAYNDPSETFSIVSVDRTLKVIQLDPPIDAVPPTWNFDDDVVPPFARLRAGKPADFGGFKSRLDVWLARPEQQPSYFVDLNRFINPLGQNANPTAGQVNDARNKVLSLVKYLTVAGATTASSDPELAVEDILSDYSVDPIPAVDGLLASFSERGADRARDLLLEGQFSLFFSLTVDGSSYSGDVLEKMRAVALLDLPVRKSKRVNALQGSTIAQVDSPDFEYDDSDTETGVLPDPPVTGESI